MYIRDNGGWKDTVDTEVAGRAKYIQGGVMNRGLLVAGPPPPPLGGCELKD